jgi:hypothetical protein
MKLLKCVQKAAAAMIGPRSADDVPAVSSPPSAHGVFRFGLLTLAVIVVLINLPLITRHYMPGHDSKMVLGIFDYMYGNWFFADELPRWMVYGLHGLDAATFHLAALSAASYVSMFCGKLLGVKDSLTLFSASVCLEQLLFLLGFHLLSRRLFQERITIFCICITAVGLVSWQTQLFFNLRLFCLLPLAFYFILRVRHDGAGYCGWLAGIVAVLGPEGFLYAYTLWALVLTVFSTAVFWGRFRRLNTMFQLRPSNMIAALCFVVMTLAFWGTLWHSLDNFAFSSPGRDGLGNVDLVSFLTYGGNKLTDMLSALLVPSAFMGDIAGRSGMTDYVGLVCFFCFPLAFLCRHNFSPAFPFLITLAIVAALSLGGLSACVIYFFPGMHLFRHVGFLTGVMRVLILIVAGFGLDALIQLSRERRLIPHPTFGMLLLICLVLLLYVDLNIGGSNWARICLAIQNGEGNFFNLLEDEEATIFTLVRAALMFAFAFAAWKSCRLTASTSARKPDFVFAFLIACIISDCLLFQAEVYYRLPSGGKPYDFPATRLSWPIPREEEAPTSAPAERQALADASGAKLLCEIARFKTVPANIILKYQAWNATAEVEYQVSTSCALQWDPPKPQFRADWLADNVVKMQEILGKVSAQDLASVSGFDGLKFRLVGDASSIHVKTDSEAFRLLGSRSGWDKQVILTDPSNGNTTNAPPTAVSDSRLDLGEFSANSFTLCLSNGLPQPAWLIYADAYAPGWHATVNQKPVPILKAYGAFKAIQVQPGASQVRFYYHNGLRSFSLIVFAAISGLAAAAALLWLIWLIMKELFAR